MATINIARDVKDNSPGIQWILENEDLSEICYSKCFFLEKTDNVFYLELSPKTEGSSTLSLWQMKGDALSTFYVLIFLRYIHTVKVFLRNTNKRTKKSPKIENIKGLYDLRSIKTSGLKEIECIAFQVEVINQTNSETDSDDEYQDADSDEEQTEEETNDEELNKSRVKYEEGKENESSRQRGEIALMEKIKDIFLNDEDSDVIIRVGDQQYPAHKVIIRALSPVFQAMLSHDMTEANEGFIDIPDCDPYIFRDFLRYLYTGKLDNITNENVLELYHIADKYDVKELRMDCVDFISESLTTDTICDVISLATRHCERELLNSATVFFTDNVKDIITTVNWQKFIQEHPIVANELFIKTVNR